MIKIKFKKDDHKLLYCEQLIAALHKLGIEWEDEYDCAPYGAHTKYKIPWVMAERSNWSLMSISIETCAPKRVLLVRLCMDNYGLYEKLRRYLIGRYL